MQHHPRNLDMLDRADLSSAIGRIAKNGMAKRCEMDPQLVRASCPGIEQDMGGQFSVSTIYPVFRHGFLGIRRAGGKLLALFAVTSDGELDEAMAFLRHSPDQGFVDPGDSVMFELSSQRSMGEIRFGDHHDSGSLLIQSM